MGCLFCAGVNGFGCAVLGSIRTWRYYRDYPRNYGGSFNPVRLWRASAIKLYDVLMAMENDIHAKPKEIRVDGGAIANNFLMQFQSDICRCPVVRPNVLETTALGAAYLAGLAIGYWKDIDELKEQWCLDKVFNPQMKEDTSRKLLNEWHKAVGVLRIGLNNENHLIGRLTS